MPWQQIQLYTDPSHAAAIETQLTDAGAIAVTYQDAADQPVFEPAVGSTPLWGQTQIIGLFEEHTDMQAVYQHLSLQIDAKTLASYQLTYLPDQAWERTWMDNFHPMRFGEHLWICPSSYPIPDPNAINILLDPGLAFGTGTHATTALCLQWLDAHPPKQERVIDYGCGSGILAIAALKLGAKEVWAIDNDPQALEATLNNATRNELAPPCVQTAFPDDDAFAQAFNFTSPTHLADTLLANILAQPLMTLAPHFAKWLKPHGNLVLSGILETQLEDVCLAYQPWFELDPPCLLDGWVRLSGCRSPRR